MPLLFQQNYSTFLKQFYCSWENNEGKVCQFSMFKNAVYANSFTHVFLIIINSLIEERGDIRMSYKMTWESTVQSLVRLCWCISWPSFCWQRLTTKWFRNDVLVPPLVMSILVLISKLFTYFCSCSHHNICTVHKSQ